MGKLSVYDLAYGYTKKYLKHKATTPVKKKVMKEFAKVLDEGWTTEEVISYIKTREREGKNLTAEVSVYFNKASREKTNLLHSDGYYLHSELRILPPPPKTFLDYDTGEIRREECAYYLEMRASYSINDLLDYYYSRHGQETSFNYKRDIGSFQYLLRQHDIDTVLHMIDAAANYISCEDLSPLESPVNLNDYEARAKEAMNFRLTEEKQAGDDKIVPRERVPIC